MRYFISSLVKLNTNTSPSTSVSAVQKYIGFTTGALFNVGMTFLGFTFLGGAFLSGCPFHSPFSSIIQSIFGFFERLHIVFMKFLTSISSRPAPHKSSPSKFVGPIFFLGFIKLRGRIWCLQDWYLVLSIFFPGHYSLRILGAEGGSSQTSNIQNLLLGDMGIRLGLIGSDHYIPIYTGMSCWSVDYLLRLLDV